MSFVHLHGHSTYSFLESIGKPKEIIAQAQEIGMKAIAITDYNGCYGLVDFYKQGKSADINAIMWVELGFVLDIHSKIQEKDIGNICFLAKNEQWYHNILKLASFANIEWLGDVRKVDIGAIQKFSEDTLVFMWGEKSWIGKMILNNEKEEKITDIIKLLIEIYTEKNIFLEIIAQDYTIMPHIKKINNTLLQIADQLHLQTIVSNNYHYIHKSDKDAREMALAIKDWYKMYDEQRRKPKGNYHIATEHEIKMIMKKNWFSDTQIQTMMDQTQTIADNCKVEIELRKTLFPNYETPEDIQELYQKYEKGLIEKS